MEELTMRVSRILSPLVTRKDLEPYIQRMVDGDTSPILTGKPITTISLSPGTTQGKPKFVPFNNDLMESTMQIYKTSFAFRNREFPIGNGKALQFIYSSKQFKTKGVHARNCYYERVRCGCIEVKVGEEYEIILTTFAGLYRYRLGDVVKVVGFHNSTPELQFICRSNLLLTINIDKNTEKDVQLSVEAAGKLFSNKKLEVVDFTSHVDLSTDPGHYVIFWKWRGSGGDLRGMLQLLGPVICRRGYVGSRKVKTIGRWNSEFLREPSKILEHYVGLGLLSASLKCAVRGAANSTVLRLRVTML
ncbi:Jasmonoyl--L-amino acid synthetase JAR4 [Camellia lanceoleosa]|uniref:Jasmonoyl--L-amino acid synthetase JAR4 n=1 Tax=Camellia lanceoleosa TaxID=1840588 RepID=A0ACC0IH85_9ERIC|nr:Jasmonoyl--L-amino acid synthetase JAR4 [Camellia lanceoleosa]